jgi:hypothetical protein
MPPPNVHIVGAQYVPNSDCHTDLTEAYITERLRRAYQPGMIASTDGYAEMYENVRLKCAAILIPLV